MEYIEALATRYKKDEEGVIAILDEWGTEAAMEQGLRWTDVDMEPYVEQFIEDKLEQIVDINEQEPKVIRMKMPDYIQKEWVYRERLMWSILQMEAVDKDQVEREPRNYYVIPADHLLTVVPDAWDDIREGEGRLSSEVDKIPYNTTTYWETFAWHNSIDTDDFEKGAHSLAPKDAWDTVIDGALDNMRFATKCYAGD